jgi:hypothetical protein
VPTVAAESNSAPRHVKGWNGASPPFHKSPKAIALLAAGPSLIVRQALGGRDCQARDTERSIVAIGASNEIAKVPVNAYKI